MATLAAQGRINVDDVEGEIARLRVSWRRVEEPETGLIEALLSEEWR